MKKSHNRLWVELVTLKLVMLAAFLGLTQGCKSTPPETDTISKQFEADWLRTNTVPFKKY